MVYTGCLALGAGALSDCVIPNKRTNERLTLSLDLRTGKDRGKNEIMESGAVSHTPTGFEEETVAKRTTAVHMAYCIFMCYCSQQHDFLPPVRCFVGPPSCTVAFACVIGQLEMT